MPNYIQNRLILLDKVDEIKTFLSSEENINVEGDEPNYISFNSFVKQPENVEDWYNWRYDNWGVKRDACNQFMPNDRTIEFQTPWYPVVELMQTLSEKFPDSEFVYQWADEALGYNCGEVIYSNKVFNVTRFKENSRDAQVFSINLWGYSDTYYIDDKGDIECREDVVPQF